MTAFSNPSNYLIVGSDPYGSGNYYIHERECKENGQPGKIITMADGKGDVKQVVQEYIEEGFDPKKIVLNGQPVTDVFQKSSN